jgi:hypothetical protein
VLFFALWDGLAGFAADCDVAVVECVCDVDGLGVRLSFVDDDGGRAPGLRLVWDHGLEDFELGLRIVFSVLNLVLDVFPFGMSDDDFHFVAECLMSFNIRWCGVVDPDSMESVLLPDLPFDFRAAPWFSAWFWFSLIGFNGVLDGFLDVVKML